MHVFCVVGPDVQWRKKNVVISWIETMVNIEFVEYEEAIFFKFKFSIQKYFGFLTKSSYKKRTTLAYIIQLFRIGFDCAGEG